MRSLSERLWEKVDVGRPDECWPWRGSKKRGYGRIRGEGGRQSRTLFAHRVVWQLEYGPIPFGLCVLHSCDNPPCCNPGHLFLGTNDDNLRDMRSKGRGGYGINPYRDARGRFASAA